VVKVEVKEEEEGEEEEHEPKAQRALEQAYGQRVKYAFSGIADM
jgi:hypothetical protein